MSQIVLTAPKMINWLHVRLRKLDARLQVLTVTQVKVWSPAPLLLVLKSLSPGWASTKEPRGREANLHFLVPFQEQFLVQDQCIQVTFCVLASS